MALGLAGNFGAIRDMDLVECMDIAQYYVNNSENLVKTVSSTSEKKSDVLGTAERSKGGSEVGEEKETGAYKAEADALKENNGSVYEHTEEETKQRPENEVSQPNNKVYMEGDGYGEDIEEDGEESFDIDGLDFDDEAEEDAEDDLDLGEEEEDESYSDEEEDAINAALAAQVMAMEAQEASSNTDAAAGEEEDGGEDSEEDDFDLGDEEEDIFDLDGLDIEKGAEEEEDDIDLGEDEEEEDDSSDTEDVDSEEEDFDFDLGEDDEEEEDIDLGGDEEDSALEQFISQANNSVDAKTNKTPKVPNVTVNKKESSAEASRFIGNTPVNKEESSEDAELEELKKQLEKQRKLREIAELRKQLSEEQRRTEEANQTASANENGKVTAVQNRQQVVRSQGQNVVSRQLAGANRGQNVGNGQPNSRRQQPGNAQATQSRPNAGTGQNVQNRTAMQNQSRPTAQTAPNRQTVQNRPMNQNPNARQPQQRNTAVNNKAVAKPDYNGMNDASLWKYMNRYLNLNGVDKAPVNKEKVIHEFGLENVERMRKKGYIMVLAKGITCG